MSARDPEKIERLSRELEDTVNTVLNKYTPLDPTDVLVVWAGLTAGLLEEINAKGIKENVDKELSKAAIFATFFELVFNFLG